NFPFSKNRTSLVITHYIIREYMRLPLCVILELLLKYIKITQSYARNLPSAYAKERLSYINKNLLI
ncbi:TPA: hypothetical protein DCX15_01650, partial [bacterium]|nr:hypothetical protein [bacterium]